MKGQTPSAEAKRIGTTIARMAAETGQSRQTIQNWFRNKPLLFKVVAIGTANITKAQEDQLVHHWQPPPKPLH